MWNYIVDSTTNHINIKLAVSEGTPALLGGPHEGAGTVTDDTCRMDFAYAFNSILRQATFDKVAGGKSTPWRQEHTITAPHDGTGTVTMSPGIAQACARNHAHAQTNHTMALGI